VTFDDWALTRLDPLLQFATVLCGSGSLAEDVVQDVLIKALGRWDTIQAADRPDSYAPHGGERVHVLAAKVVAGSPAA
jgi:DNA-directed RNA polymerase specialized sigma24 family protein